MLKSLILLFVFLAADGCSTEQNQTKLNEESSVLTTSELDKKFADKDVAYFASGCFWCVEEIFESLRGVEEVVSGYAGGTKENATYDKVSAGSTKHAEAVKIYYDKNVISYKQLVEVFFGSHDATTLNRQGPDRGYQYRSAIFYQNEEEKKIAEEFISMLSNAPEYVNPITTELNPFKAFHPAEDYHQDYVVNHPNNGYVKAVSQPRFEAFKAKFPELLKKEKH
jgi:peptide-methionine (S)-S-oxide reductase